MKKCIIFVLGISIALSAFAEIHVRRLSDAEQQVAEQTIGSIRFSHSWLYLVATDGTILGQERISDVRSLFFPSHIGTDMEELSQETQLIRVYPNPTHEMLYIDSANDMPYSIYSLDGQCLLKGNGREIPVATFEAGTYLLQFNTNIIKFIKQ